MSDQHLVSQVICLFWVTVAFCFSFSASDVCVCLRGGRVWREGGDQELFIFLRLFLPQYHFYISGVSIKY